MSKKQQRLAQWIFSGWNKLVDSNDSAQRHRYSDQTTFSEHFSPLEHKKIITDIGTMSMQQTTEYK